jgi:hypothetical protein
MGRSPKIFSGQTKWRTNTLEKPGLELLHITSLTVSFPPANGSVVRCRLRIRSLSCERSRGGRYGTCPTQATKFESWPATSTLRIFASRTRATTIRLVVSLPMTLGRPLVSPGIWGVLVSLAFRNPL